MSWLAAAELRPGVVLVEHDWRLHVQCVSVADSGRVAIQTVEFPGFALHRAAGELVAIEPTAAELVGDLSRVDVRPGNETEATTTARAA
jgi:hypothetical protein